MGGLAELHLFSGTREGDRHTSGKGTGTDAEKCQPVSMRRVHVCLNFEDKPTEERIGWFDFSGGRLSRSGGGRPFQEMFQKRSDPKVCQCGTKKDGRKFSFRDGFQVKRVAGAVQQFHFSAQNIQIGIGNHTFQGITKYAVCAKFDYPVLLFV